MENYNNDYNAEEDYGYPYEQPQQSKSVKGLKIMIIILAVILAGLSFLYYSQVRQMKAEYNEERDTLTNRLSSLMMDYEGLRTDYDTINKNLVEERGRVDSLMQSLQSERNLNRAKIRDYEKQIGLMRGVMEGYLFQIDSLNTLNKKLADENVGYRREIATVRLRADMAEEKADELTTQVRKGAVIRARDINLVALSGNDREVTRAGRASRLRADCVLNGNELSNPGKRNVYVRIIGPDGYVMAENVNNTFDYEGDMITYSAVRRDVDYQNEDLPVSIFYNGSGIVAGKYSVMIYMDGHLIGQTEIMLR